MKTLGRGSLASMLKLLLDITWYLSWVFLTFASLVLVASGAAILMNFFGYTPGVVSSFFDALHEHGWIYPIFVAEIIALMIIVHRLRRIFATLIAGDPFVPENAGHLRVIALAIAGYQILRHATQGAVAMVLTLMDQPVVGGADLDITPDVDLGAWFAVATLLVFAEVFREGARMRQEQKLTI
jgi:hypothetical protein